MGGILETAMLICFGCSWPINLVKNYKCRSAKGMSLPFILLLMVGYIAGISAKFILGVNVHNAYVLVVYLLNLAMVTANLFVYFRNCALDRKAELCAEPEADDTAMDLMAASVAEQVQQHDLEGAEEDERKGQPDHHARAAQRHAPHHVESQRHEDQRLDGPQGIGFRIGQHQIGNDQRHEEIDGQQRRETTACLDRPPPDFLVGISFHILRYSLACQKASLILSRNPLVFLPNP